MRMALLTASYRFDKLKSHIKKEHGERAKYLSHDKLTFSNILLKTFPWIHLQNS